MIQDTVKTVLRSSYLIRWHHLVVFIHFQPFSAISAIPGISSNFHPFQASCLIHFKPCEGFSSQSSHLHLFQPFPAISNHFQPILSISSHFHQILARGWDPLVISHKCQLICWLILAPRPPMHFLHKTFPGTTDETSHCAMFHSSCCLISWFPKTDLCETTGCSPPLPAISSYFYQFLANVSHF